MKETGIRPTSSERVSENKSELKCVGKDLKATFFNLTLLFHNYYTKKKKNKQTKKSNFWA